MRASGSVGRVLGLGLFGTAESSVRDLSVRRLTTRQPLRWWLGCEQWLLYFP